MLQPRFLFAAVLLVLLVAAAQSAFAADLAPPSWRGQAGTTFQQWDFATDANPAAPEAANNPYGAPSAAVTVGEFGSGWFHQLPGMGNATGYWDLGSGGTIRCDIPSNAGPALEVWVQVTYFLDLTDAPAISVDNGTEMDAQVLLAEDVDTGGSWLLDQSVWHVQPGSASEFVVFTGDPMWGTVIDSVVVDTRVVPEPASLTAMLLGVCGIVIRRRVA